MNFVHHAYRALFARPYFQRFNTVLFHLSLHGLGILNYRNDKDSGEHHFVTRELPRLLATKTPVCFDVGANVGGFSLLLLSTFPAATIHAFEPHPANFARLLSLARERSGLTCHHLGVGDSAGVVTLYDRADLQGSTHASLYEEVISKVHKKEVATVDVNLITLDEIASREDIDRIDFLKVDTEGHELAVLRGAKGLIEQQKIRCIQFEFNEMNVTSRAFLKDFRELLRDYSLFRLLPKGMIPLGDSALQTELFAFQNIVAIQNR